MRLLRARPLVAVLLVMLLIVVLTGAAYAIGRLAGYIPGIGFVETGSLRVLAEPASQTRDGITVTILQVAADSERTVVVYKTEGMTVQAANSRGEGGGPGGFGSKDVLRLPDGTLLNESPSLGYAGTPEPIIDSIHAEGGWPNYVYRLVYPPVNPRIGELTLLIPVLQNMPAGAAPENWEVPFRLKTAPPEMTFEPIIEFTQPADASSGATPLAGSTQAASSTVSALNGVTLQLDSVIETQDGFVFTGDLSWDSSVFPAGGGTLEQDLPFALTDENGQDIPIEAVQVDAPYREGHYAWSYRTNRKAFAGPLTLSLASLPTIRFAPKAEFELDLGAAPQIGQVWDVNRDFVFEGRAVRLLSVALQATPPLHTNDPCVAQKANLLFSFTADEPGIYATVLDLNPEPTPVGRCVSGSWGGNGPTDPRNFSGGTGYLEMPRGVHRFSISASVPRTVTGPWKVTWQPPQTTAAVPTAQPGACFTQEAWKQALARTDALPTGIAGKLASTVAEGTGNLPAVHLEDMDGNLLHDFGMGSWPSLSRDGTRLAYSGSDAVHLVDLSSGQESTLVSDGYNFHWSPDNTRLLYTNSFSLYVINADGSGLRQIDTGAATIVSVVGWLPDNQTVVYGAMGGAGFTFTTYNLQSGESRSLFTVQNKAGYGALSPDGQWILFSDRTFGADGPATFVSRLDGSDRRMVSSPDVPSAFAALWSPDGKWVLLQTLTPQGQDTFLVNPFSCENAHISGIKSMVESWSP